MKPVPSLHPSALGAQGQLPEYWTSGSKSSGIKVSPTLAACATVLQPASGHLMEVRAALRS